jgi:hypothetical protein
MLNEYADAFAGIPQYPDNTGKFLGMAACRLGPPKLPTGLRPKLSLSFAPYMEVIGTPLR